VDEFQDAHAFRRVLPDPVSNPREAPRACPLNGPQGPAKDTTVDDPSVVIERPFSASQRADLSARQRSRSVAQRGAPEGVSPPLALPTSKERLRPDRSLFFAKTKETDRLQPSLDRSTPYPDTLIDLGIN
jgi:hypothetical protein